MTATDELRKLLDERGVEWSKPSDEYWELLGGIPISDYVTVVGSVSIDEATDGTLVVNNLTPAQAIEATLGRGECRITDNGPWGYPYVCSVCGASFDPDVNNGEFNYCPNCGAKVVSE